MKKIILFVVIALLSITTISSVNAQDYLIINDKQIAEWRNIFIYSWAKDNSIYYNIKDTDDSIKYYKYNSWDIIEIKENEIDNSDLSNQTKWTISNHYKLEKNEYGDRDVYVNGKLVGGNITPDDTFSEISNNAFYYTNVGNRQRSYTVFIFEDKKIKLTPIQETPKTTKANPQLDKALKPFFEKTDKKWDEMAQKTYKTLISKIDILLKKRLSVKNKNTLNYLKEKVQEKIK